MPSANKDVLAVIPARGGSKGLPGKNILPLNGKPLLVYTAESALNAKTINRVILSTDSPEIAQIGEGIGLEIPFLRPDHLAADASHPVSVIAHLLSFLEEHDGYDPDIVVTLQPTSPLRSSENIDQTVDRLREDSTMDSVITVQQVVLPPFWMLRIDGLSLKPFINDGVDYSLKRRQELDSIYKPNGAVYATRTHLIRDHGRLFSAFSGGNTGFVLMDQLTSLEIDTETDFMIVEAFLRGQLKQ